MKIKQARELITDTQTLLTLLEWDLKKLLDKEYILNKTEQELVLKFYKLKNIPVSFFLKKTYFYNSVINIKNNVFAPRSDTECIVQEILKDTRNNLDILELGTGSGAISIAISKQRPKWNILATDISKIAIECAKENIYNNKCTNIVLVISNWYSKIHGCFDIIVSNPPYININLNSSLEILTDPFNSLYSSKSGLMDIFNIIKGAKLNKNGKIILEHSSNDYKKIAKFAFPLKSKQILNNNGLIIGSILF